MVAPVAVRMCTQANAREMESATPVGRRSSVVGCHRVRECVVCVLCVTCASASVYDGGLVGLGLGRPASGIRGGAGVGVGVTRHRHHNQPQLQPQSEDEDERARA